MKPIETCKDWHMPILLRKCFSQVSDMYAPKTSKNNEEIQKIINFTTFWPMQ